jgi:short-subunit dehydrogenase
MRNKSAIITGASRGVGRELSKHLSGQGYNLLLIARTSELLDELSDEIHEKDETIYIKKAALDVFDAEKINSVIKDFYQTTQSIDVLFNNAGYVKQGTSDVDPVELSKMINSNVIGAINMVRFTVPFMRLQNRGCIINMCSRNAEKPRSFLGGYAASKAALLAFNESLYKEMKDTSIKVTALCPGFIDTQMTDKVKEDRSRLIKTEDICMIVDFLLSLPVTLAMKELSFESIVQVGSYC